MPKSGKSSASSATRKKHARKAATATGDEPVVAPPASKKIKPKKGEKPPPRVKQYIAPSKPAPAKVDPLDSLGLVHTLDQDLVVILRRLAKKDSVTREKAIEDLRIWMDHHEGPVVSEMIPVWLNHLPSLVIHPSKRLRVLSSSLHGKLLAVPETRAVMLDFFIQTADVSESKLILGAWLLSAYDVDRSVRREALQNWENFVSTKTASLDDYHVKTQLDLEGHGLLDTLCDFSSHALFNTDDIFLEIFPPAPVALPLPSKGGSQRRDLGKQQTLPAGLSIEESTRKSLVDEEADADRRARLRVGSLGALRWLLEYFRNSSTKPQGILAMLRAILFEPATFSSLFHGHSFVHTPTLSHDSFGYSQPLVRQSAWELVLSISQLRAEINLQDLSFRMLNVYAMGSAWDEPDPSVRTSLLVPLITLLKNVPGVWMISNKESQARHDAKPYETASDSEDDDADEETGRSYDGEMEPTVRRGDVNTPSVVDSDNWPYHKFLKFLRSGCNGSPLEGYPIVVLALSTIPIAVLSLDSKPVLLELFDHLWAGLESHSVTASLQRNVIVVAFLEALLDSVWFCARRLINGDRAQKEQGGLGNLGHLAQWLVQTQWDEVWRRILSGSLRINESLLGSSVGKGLIRMNSISHDLFDCAWKLIISLDPAELMSTLSDVNILRIIRATEVKIPAKEGVDSDLPQPLPPLVRQWTRQTLELQNISTEEKKAQQLNFLVELIRCYPTYLTTDSVVVNLLDGFVAHTLQHANSLAIIPSQILSLFKEYALLQPRRATAMWSLLTSSASRNEALLSVLLEERLLPEVQSPDAEVFRGIVAHSLSSAFDPEDPQSEQCISLMEKLLSKRNAFLDDQLVEQIMAKMRAETELATSGLINGTDEVPIINTCRRLSLHLLSQMNANDAFSAHLIANMFIQADLLASSHTSLTNDLNNLINDWIRYSSPDAKQGVAINVRGHAKDAIISCRTHFSPSVFLNLALGASRITGSSDIAIDDVLPARQFFDESLAEIADLPASPSLAVFDTLVSVEAESLSTRAQSYDEDGRTSYCRALIALLSFVSLHRHISRLNPWVLEHLAILELLTRDFILSPVSLNPLFRRTGLEIPPRAIKRLLDDSKKSITYILSFFSSRLDTNWHRTIEVKFSRPVPSDDSPKADPFSVFVQALLTRSIQSSSATRSRVLRTVLHGVLRESSVPEVDIWLSVAQKVLEQFQAGETVSAICACLIELNMETPRLDRFRNDLASRLSGVTSPVANTEGLRLLRLLNACAPSESDAAFLPQRRAVFMLQGLQKWFAEDAELGAQLGLELTTVLIHIVPLVQSLPGAHWDFISSLIEMNLEESSFNFPGTIPLLYRTLKLLMKVDDFASSNKALDSDWRDRRRDIYPHAWKLFLEPIDPVARSAATDEVHSLVADIASYTSAGMIDDSSFGPLCGLLRDSSLKVKITAYELLVVSGRSRTEKMVIEAEVDVAGDFHASVPSELMDLLSSDVQMDDVSGGVLSFLLGWTVMFDIFSAATPRIKQSYIDQLREAQVTERYLLPLIFEMLNVGSSGRPFPLDPWSLDEFYVSLYDASLPGSLCILAAHLYYRALMTIPSIVQAWWLDCKDRQLSIAVAHFTSQQFAPIIIKRHLDNVRSLDVRELQDDAFGVKIIPAMREIHATYNIDDQQMEISLQFPPDYPLHGTEVKDITKVGVQENKWRAWLLNVQQISQNGLIVDALFWFKKNVASHFEGKTECAICYSIISVIDRSLPTKPCKTCKNRFHASCLFKWFKSSHSSSCPLCRSNIF